MFSAIFKLNVRRFWWISVLNAFLLAIFFVIPLIDTKSYYYSNDIMCIFPLAFGAINGWAVFGYLNSDRSVGFYHSAPTSRNTVFAANVIFGGLSCVLPNLVTAVFIPMLAASLTDSTMVSFGYIFSRGVVYSLTLFSLACFTSMFTGSSSAQKLFTPIIAVLPWFFEGFINTLKQCFLYGSKYSYTSFLEELFLNDRMRPFCVLIPLLIIFAYIAYRLRPMEAAGEIVVYGWAKWLFVQGMALCFGVTISAISFGGNISFVKITLIGLVFALIALMLLQKTFRIKGFLKHGLVFIGIMSALFAVFELDITGFEKRVPRAEQVKSVTVNASNYDIGTDISISDPEIIRSVIKAHNQLVQIREGEYHRVSIKYTLKNGKTLQRLYETPGKGAMELINEVIMTDAYKRSYFCLDEEWKNVILEGRMILNSDAAALKEVLEADVLSYSGSDLYENVYSIVSFSDNPRHILISEGLVKTQKFINELMPKYIMDIEETIE